MHYTSNCLNLFLFFKIFIHQLTSIINKLNKITFWIRARCSNYSNEYYYYFFIYNMYGIVKGMYDIRRGIFFLKKGGFYITQRFFHFTFDSRCLESSRDSSKRSLRVIGLYRNRLNNHSVGCIPLEMSTNTNITFRYLYKCTQPH